MSAKDPIVAIATAPGRGAVGIVRLSGANLAPIAQALLGAAAWPHWPARVARYQSFQDANGQVIDAGLALFFPAPHSYTGEDVLELQVHGGTVVLQLLLARCLQAGRPYGLRLAQAGEFTQRAFLNDKLDLAQAEAVADLIDASTEAAARSASRSLSGAFSQTIQTLLEQLIRLRLLVEATIDFPEEDIDFLQQSDAAGQLTQLQHQLSLVMQRTRQGALLREGIQLVIAGQPNAGKSSLLNALAGAELAIVTPIAGTTRDIVQQTIQIEGVPIHVLDTAGLRDPAGAETIDAVEQLGIARAWERIGQADAVLLLHDLTRRDDPAYAALDQTIRQQIPTGLRVIDVWNKVDAATPTQGLETAAAPEPAIHISAKTGAGLDALRQAILQAVGWHADIEGVFIARQRHITALQSVSEHLAAAQAQLTGRAPALEIIAEELRLAQNALSSITGEFTPDDLLGEIFSKFCIGK